MPRVKVCGLTRTADARAAARMGADYLGAIHVPGTPRSVAPSTARRVAREGGLPLVLVVAGLPIRALVDVASVALPQVLQLHGDEPLETVRGLREEGEWRLWVSVRFRDRDRLRKRVEAVSPWIDGILLDRWEPDKLGGTGRPFPWDEASGVREWLPNGVELVVAGGLDPGNVGEAVRRFRPDVLDVSSSVETAPGRKDPGRIQAFVQAVRRTAEASSPPTRPGVEATE